MCTLVKLYASHLLKPEAITAASDNLSLLNLSLLNLSHENQLPDENLGIGTETWRSLVELEAEWELKPFFSAVRKFFIASITKMLKKFPFGDSILKDLGVLQPQQTASYSIDTILGLAKRFPQLDLADSASLDQLREEFMDFILPQADLPSLTDYHAADGTIKPRVGQFWHKVEQLKTLEGQNRFSTLCKLMYGLLSIPCSNYDSERGFPILRKIHTDRRSNLDQSTIIALMSMKFNSDECCHDITVDSKLLTQCKKATRQSLQN